MFLLKVTPATDEDQVRILFPFCLGLVSFALHFQDPAAVGSSGALTYYSLAASAMQFSRNLRHGALEPIISDLRRALRLFASLSSV